MKKSFVFWLAGRKWKNLKVLASRVVKGDSFTFNCEECANKPKMLENVLHLVSQHLLYTFISQTVFADNIFRRQRFYRLLFVALQNSHKFVQVFFFTNLRELQNKITRAKFEHYFPSVGITYSHANKKRSIKHKYCTLRITYVNCASRSASDWNHRRASDLKLIGMRTERH